MKAIYLAALLAISGCATTPGGILKEPVERTYSSAKAPLDVAKCLQAQTRGLDIEFVGDDVSVSSRNGYGNIIINWFIRPIANGSSIELRKTNSIASGVAQAETCF